MLSNARQQRVTLLHEQAPEVAPPTPIQWVSSYLDMLFGNEWGLTKSPDGALTVDADDAARRLPIIMTTVDKNLRCANHSPTG